MSEVLLRCPFCDRIALPVERHNPMSKWRWSVDCQSSTCGMSGPVEATKADAIAAWNTRAPIAGQAELVETLLGLEQACEQLAATRTREVYFAMIESGQSEAMLSLDARRQAARQALAAHQPRPHSKRSEA